MEAPECGICAVVEFPNQFRFLAGVSTPRSTSTLLPQHIAADLFVRSHVCAAPPSAGHYVMHAETHEDIEALPQCVNSTGCVSMELRHYSEVHTECDLDVTQAHHLNNAHSSGSSPQMHITCTVTESDKCMNATCSWNGTLLVQGGQVANADILQTSSGLQSSASGRPAPTSAQILLPCTRTTTNAAGVKSMRIHALVVQSMLMRGM